MGFAVILIGFAANLLAFAADFLASASAWAIISLMVGYPGGSLRNPEGKNSPGPRPIGRYTGLGSLQPKSMLALAGPEKVERFEFCLLLLAALRATIPAKGEAELFIANGLVIGCIDTCVEDCGVAGFATATRSLGFLIEASDGACFLSGCVNTGLVLEKAFCLLVWNQAVSPCSNNRIQVWRKRVWGL